MFDQGSRVPRSVEEAFVSLIDTAPAPDACCEGRVVLVIGNLSPGGAERQAANTAIGLRRSGVDVTLLAHTLDNEKLRYDFHLGRVRAADVMAREIQRHVTSGGDPRLPRALANAAVFMPEGVAVDILNLMLEFRRLRPQIVHAWLDWDNVRAGLAAVMSGVPRVVLSGRNLNPSRYSFNQPYMRPAYQALATASQVHIINNSRAGADDYATWIGVAPGRIGVIPNGVDFGSQTGLSPAAIAKAREDFGIPQDAFVVGGVFRLVEQKRPMLWLDAAARIAAAIPEARFLIYGQGSFLPAMQERIRAPDLANRVTLAGVTDRPLEAMSLFDIFLLTSRGEGLPNVLLEAESVGTPVVATRAGGAPEAIADGLTGWVIDEPSAEAIAAKIVDLKRRPDRLRAAADAASAFVKQSFGVTQMIGSTLELYGLDSAPR